MLPDTPNRIADVNQKYIGTRVNVRRTQTFLPGSQVSPAGISIPASSITRRGPVTTVGGLAPLIQPDPISTPYTPASPQRNTGRIDTETPGFEGFVNTHPPSQLWDQSTPPQKKGIFEKLKGCCRCPWWLGLLLSLLFLSAIIGGLYWFFRGRKINERADDPNVKPNQDWRSDVNPNINANVNPNTPDGSYNQNGNQNYQYNERPSPGDSQSNTTYRNPSDGGSISINNNANTKETTTDRKEILNCNPGYFLHNGKCLSCPGESKWNGTNCIKTQLVNTTITTITNSSGTFVLSSDHKVVQLKHL